MSHSINFLKDNEIRYLSAVESNPLYKWSAIGAVGLVVCGAGLYFYLLKQTVTEAEKLTKRWGAIEERVAAAEERNAQRNRLHVGLQTLKGWNTSRISWWEMMNYIVEQAPGSIEDIQFTRLEADEVMIGLRNKGLGGGAGDFFPIKRNVTLNLRGVVRSMRPERPLTQFQRNLLNSDAPVPIEEVSLDRYSQIRNNGEITDRTTFAFTIRIAPLDVMPPEEEPSEEETP